MTASRLFTSESVSDGHPDKICDQVSDALLDNLLQRDPDARAGLECLCAKDFMIIAGEMRSREEMDADTIATIARDTIREIGYVFDGFNADTLTIDTRVQPQSLDIALGVDAGSRESEGAGDQGMMFGFACNETDSFMPAAIDISHRIVRRLSERRRAGQLLGLLPDAKSQVTLLYDENGPVRCDTVLVSCHHEERLSTADVTDMLLPEIRAAVPEALLDEDTRFLINPTGRFVIGGPESDTGLTGRKIVVDTYGGSALHGGGSLFGEGPDEGGPLSRICSAVSCQECCGCGSRCTLSNPDCLRNRGAGACVCFGGNAGYCASGRTRDSSGSTPLGRPAPARHHSASQSRPSDIPPDGYFWTFRSRSRKRRHIHLGKNRSCRYLEE